MHGPRLHRRASVAALKPLASLARRQPVGIGKLPSIMVLSLLFDPEDCDRELAKASQCICSNNCVVFDPGAAHKSRTRWYDRGRRIKGGSMLAISCLWISPRSCFSVNQTCSARTSKPVSPAYAHALDSALSWALLTLIWNTPEKGNQWTISHQRLGIFATWQKTLVRKVTGRGC